MRRLWQPNQASRHAIKWPRRDSLLRVQPRPQCDIRADAGYPLKYQSIDAPETLPGEYSGAHPASAAAPGVAYRNSLKTSQPPHPCCAARQTGCCECFGFRQRNRWRNCTWGQTGRPTRHCSRSDKAHLHPRQPGLPAATEYDLPGATTGRRGTPVPAVRRNRHRQQFHG